MSANLSAILYLISGVLFILALRGLSSPETSRQGNLFGIIGMVIAISVTFLSVGNFSSGFIYVLNIFSNWGKYRSIYCIPNSNDSNARISCWLFIV
jgi:NAD/NADP transhydrogenase beta subunit